MDVQDHYTAWRQTQDQPSRRHGGDGPFSFCSYPFLLDPRAKSNLLHIEARFQMEQVRCFKLFALLVSEAAVLWNVGSVWCQQQQVDLQDCRGLRRHLLVLWRPGDVSANCSAREAIAVGVKFAHVAPGMVQ
jgi:hypothetical protein